MGVVRHKQMKDKYYNGDIKHKRRGGNIFRGPTTSSRASKATPNTPLSQSSTPITPIRNTNFLNMKNMSGLSTKETSRTSEKDDFDNNVHVYDDYVESDDTCYWERPSLIIHHIFWMSFCDVIFCIWEIALFGPNIFGFDGWKQDKNICYMYGLVAQFAICGSVVWYLVVAWCLFSILFNIGVNTRNFEKDRVYHSIFAWFITGICCIIPMVYDQYGRTNIYSGFFSIKNNNYETECWLEKPKFYLTLYIPVTISAVFALFVLMAVWRKYYRFECDCVQCIRYYHYCCCLPCYFICICVNFCSQSISNICCCCCGGCNWCNNVNSKNSSNRSTVSGGNTSENEKNREHYELRIDSSNNMMDYGTGGSQRRLSKSSTISKMSQKTHTSHISHMSYLSHLTHLSRQSRGASKASHASHASHGSSHTYVAYDKDRDDQASVSYLNDEWICCDGCRQKCIDIFVLNEDRASISEFGYLDTSDHQIISRLTLFTLIFVIIWIFPIINRLYQAVARMYMYSIMHIYNL